ncbi:MAG: MFS transporter, partial [Alcaligenaceae bacterium]
MLLSHSKSVNVSTITKSRASVALFLGILLIALNLRAPFTALAPVLTFVQHDFALSTAAVGALTSLPLLAFAVFSPLSATLAERFGLERTLFAALVVVAVGIALRSTGSIWLLFAGTAIIGMGIAQGNVLLPSLIKRDFSQNVAAVTGAYALAMGVGGALGSSVVFPLTQAFGWQIALAAFVALPAVALLIWAPQLKERANIAPAQEARKQVGTIWRSALAWQVTMFMGLNAMIFYIAIGWLPTILIDQ